MYSRYYAKCEHINNENEIEMITVIVDSKSIEKAVYKINKRYNIDEIVEFTNIKPIYKYTFEGCMVD